MLLVNYTLVHEFVPHRDKPEGGIAQPAQVHAPFVSHCFERGPVCSAIRSVQVGSQIMEVRVLDGGITRLYTSLEFGDAPPPFLLIVVETQLRVGRKKQRFERLERREEKQ